MKRIITIPAIILLIVFAIISKSYSQVSGYLGKRNALKGSVFLKNSFTYPNKNGENGFFSFNDRWSFEYERVINRKYSLLMHVSYFQTRLSFKDDYKNIRSNGYFTYSYPATDYMPQMDGYGFGADYRYYSSSHLSPLGSFISVGFDYFRLNAAINKEDYYILSKYENPDLLELPDSKRGVFGLNVKWGTQQIFFDRITFESSFHIGFMFAGIGSISDRNPFDPDDGELLQKSMGKRILSHYLWGVNFCIGYLF